jgi:RHS repeat-associated protein
VYLHTDHLGTPRLATDQTGTLIWRGVGSAFGEVGPNEDPDNDGNLTTINLRYPGQYFDSETGLYYWGARYYDPKTGRGISADRMSVAEHVERWKANLGVLGQPPLEINPYAYVANNPLRWIDPLGLAANPPICTGPDCINPPYDPTPDGPKPSPQPKPPQKPRGLGTDCTTLPTPHACRSCCETIAGQLGTTGAIGSGCTEACLRKEGITRNDQQQCKN